VRKRKGFTLMPAITLASLSLLIGLPSLSGISLYAATSEKFTPVVVRPGDTLWHLAAVHTPTGGSVQETVDSIEAANHLSSATLTPGEKIRIPSSH